MRRRADPTARRVALAIGAARVGLGVGALFLTRPTLRALLFDETDGTGRALARLAGGRDLALGLATLAARGDDEALARLSLLAALLDGADAIAMSVSARDPQVRLAALGGVASGGAAAVAGIWSAARLRSPSSPDSSAG